MDTVEKAVRSVSSRVVRLERAGKPPSQAHEPKATRIFDFRRSSSAMCWFSLLRMAPLKRHSVID